MATRQQKKVGKVVQVLSPTEVVVNLGLADGVDHDTHFLLYRTGEEVRDPDTNESLGPLEVVRGIGRVKHVQDRLTTVVSARRKRARRLVRKHYPASTIGMYIVPEEEIIEEGDPEPFDNAQIGDMVRMQG